MKIDYQIGNMFENYHEPIIFLAHGCNAKGVMGSGVAAEVRDRYPWAYSKYRKKFQESGLAPGSVVEASKYVDDRTIYVFNCITQNLYGRDGRRYANYGAIQKCIRQIDFLVTTKSAFDTIKPEVRFPMIGASLGGADWNIISKIIERESENFRPVVYDMTP